MRKICIINQKGGVAKTTTTVNLASALAANEKRVLVIDLDPQGNISTCFCVNNDKTTYDLLINDIDIYDCIVNIAENLDVITSDSSLAKAELIITGQTSRETVLRRKLEGVFNYDYVLIDCPPSLSLLNINALLYANEAFVPVATDFLALDALKKITQTITEINELFDHDIKITQVIPTLYDQRNKACKQTLKDIKRGYEELVSNPIRINSKLREAPSVGKDIFEYAKRSSGAKDYLKLAKTVLEAEEYL
ncbi:chromosome partitioning protein ParA [Candidatus Woesearchaeota archaeon CG10_big_fil_rev_8_21_14_0_10_34_8]|nr:MAG: chromosome partitioning protein ParA [Candidatus Woesearchaeota archaeon CG10_big_fil_rev_8_21_14_0_10_34_8]